MIYYILIKLKKYIIIKNKNIYLINYNIFNKPEIKKFQMAKFDSFILFVLYYLYKFKYLLLTKDIRFN